MGNIMKSVFKVSALLLLLVSFNSFSAKVEDTQIEAVGGCVATVKTLDVGKQTIMQCPNGAITTTYPDGSIVVIQNGQVINLDAPK